MRKLLTVVLLATGGFIWAAETVVAESFSNDCIVDTRDTLGYKLVHGTVRISPVDQEANPNALLLIDENSPEWSAQTPMWDSTAVADGVHEAALYETENPAKAEMVVLNDSNYVYENGTLEGDVTWNNDAIHIVQYGMKIPEDSTLTVTDGAVVKLCQDAEIITNGLMTVKNGAVLSNLTEREIVGPDITIDSELSDTSTNPVENRVVAGAIDSLQSTDTELAESISTLKTDVETLQASATGIQNSLTQLQTDSTATKEALTENQNAVENLQDSVAALQTSGKTHDAAITALQNDNAELKSQLTALLTLLNGGTEGQVLTKTKDGSYAWMDSNQKAPEVKTLALAAGWNLVAMPGNCIFEKSDEALLNNIDIYTFDRETKIYIPADGLKPLTSYWFFAKEPCTIHFAVIAGE